MARRESGTDYRPVQQVVHEQMLQHRIGLTSSIMYDVGVTASGPIRGDGTEGVSRSSKQMPPRRKSIKRVTQSTTDTIVQTRKTPGILDTQHERK